MKNKFQASVVKMSKSGKSILIKSKEIKYWIYAPTKFIKNYNDNTIKDIKKYGFLTDVDNLYQNNEWYRSQDIEVAFKDVIEKSVTPWTNNEIDYIVNSICLILDEKDNLNLADKKQLYLEFVEEFDKLHSFSSAKMLIDNALSYLRHPKYLKFSTGSSKLKKIIDETYSAYKFETELETHKSKETLKRTLNSSQTMEIATHALNHNREIVKQKNGTFIIVEGKKMSLEKYNDKFLRN